MKRQIHVDTSTYEHSVLAYDTETLAITFEYSTWNSHGTTETYHGEEIVNPPDLYEYLRKHFREEKVREIMANPVLDDVSKRYAEQVQPFLQIYKELQHRIPLGWSSWEIGARLHTGSSSTIFRARWKKESAARARIVPMGYMLSYLTMKSKYQKSGELWEYSYPHDQQSKRVEKYLRKKVLEEAKRDLRSGKCSDPAILKFCDFLPSTTPDDARAVCAFLMRNRNEDTIHHLDAWHLMQGADQQLSWLVLRQKALQPLTSGVPDGLSYSSDVYRLYLDPDQALENSHYSLSESKENTWVRSLSPEYVLKQARRIAKALSLCHQDGIIHRDVTVDNLFCVNEKNDLCLGDFGIACRLPARFSRVSYGTPIFMPPEMLNGLPYDFSADVFALGRCMQLMLWGMQMPCASQPFWFGELNQKELKPAISDDFWQVISKATATVASERYRDGSALLMALNAVRTAL